MKLGCFLPSGSYIVSIVRLEKVLSHSRPDCVRTAAGLCFHLANTWRLVESSVSAPGVALPWPPVSERVRRPGTKVTGQERASGRLAG